MRKFLALTIILLLGVAGVSAKNNPLRLQSGSLLPLKNASGQICINFDFSKTKGNKKPLQQYLEEDMGQSIEAFNHFKPEMQRWFMERWDDDIENGPRATTSEDANYRLDIIIKNISLGANSGYGAASISGKAEFYREGETEPFAVVEILKMNGTMMGTGMHGYVGLQQAFNDLAEFLCHMIYKSK